MKFVTILLFLFLLGFSSHLRADATISGVVRSQSGGTPISGASVILVRGSQHIVASTFTASDGSYDFTGVNPGQYTVVAAASGFQTSSVGAKAKNNQTTIVDFDLLAIFGAISGQVKDAKTLLPISGASIYILKQNLLVASTTTDGNGDYIVDGLEPGSYAIIATATSYQGAIQGIIVQSAHTSIADFLLVTPPGTVTGIVTASNSGLPIAGAIVELAFENQVIYEAISDALGGYTITSVSPGTYTAVANADSYQTQSTDIIVQAGQTTVLDFSLSANQGAISGVVKDANTTQPIAGALVQVLSNNVLIGFTLTDPSGNYTINDLTPGTYQVLASASNYKFESLSANVLSNQTTTVNFSLAGNPSSVQGQVVDALTGQPIPGVFIVFFQNSSFAGVTLTDGNGDYMISDLDPGTYNLNAILRGYYSKTVSFPLATGETLTVNLNLTPDSPPQNLTGSVINNRFLLQADRIHHIQWEKSQDPTVLYYQIYRNGSILATISANDPLEYDDHNRSYQNVDIYSINDVNAANDESSFVSISLR